MSIGTEGPKPEEADSVQSLAVPDRAATVRSAMTGDRAAIQAVGAAAGERFRSIEDPRVARCADDPPLSLEALSRYVRGGRAWVALVGDEVVGFAVADPLDGGAHLEEVAVRPEHEGRGIGSDLLRLVEGWAASAGLDGVTLTTFRDVPWNRPFYERRGFVVVPDEELTLGLVARREDEAAHGLDPELRVVMRRRGSR